MSSRREYNRITVELERTFQRLWKGGGLPSHAIPNGAQMRILLLFAILVWINTPSVWGQKKPLDHEVYDQWENISEQAISPDGRYLAYTVFSGAGASKLFLKASDGSWEKMANGARSITISGDSRFAAYQAASTSTDQANLVVVTLGTDQVLEIPKVASFKIPTIGRTSWMAYLQSGNLTLHDVQTGTTFRYPNVNDYLFSNDGEVLLFKSVNTGGQDDTGSASSLLVRVNARTGQADTILNRFHEARQFAFDATGNQVAFLLKRQPDQASYELAHYAVGMDSARAAGNPAVWEMQRQLAVSGRSRLQFSKDGKKLFFELESVSSSTDASREAGEDVQLEIWDYRAEVLPPKQQRDREMGSNRETHHAVIHLEEGRVVRLASDHGEARMVLPADGADDYALLASTRGNLQVSFEEPFLKETAWVVSLEDGSRERVATRQYNNEFAMSPAGKYAIWFDRDKGHYFVHNIARRTTQNISARVPATLSREADDWTEAAPPPKYGIAGWVENDAAVLAYDRYDIWRLDPEGQLPPVNLTGGLGRNDQIVLRLVHKGGAIRPQEELLIHAFDTQSRYAGFYSLRLDEPGPAERLTMGPYAYDIFHIDRARDANHWILRRMSVQESPDLYHTSDFRSFTRASRINRQQDEYNWMTCELVEWETFDGKVSQGLLYKPEDFDPDHKYPVIFFFYEEYSEELFHYKAAAPMWGSINIPYFVSNGYLVFVPDIQYTVGAPGESAYNSVVSAAQHLGKYPWVDGTRMGLNGHSFGGYQVNYIITRTPMFAAAVPSYGMSNLISDYGLLYWDQGGINRYYLYEGGISRIGATLWEAPELYIKNSPLFAADQIQTPVLILHNDKDGAVHWFQGLELFNALRRLEKPVWLLHYKDEYHGLMEPKNRKDFSIRAAAFFDHFLKGKPAPQWMNGVVE